MHEHIMIIGGTGMLKAASIVLAERCATLTSIASTRKSLDSLGRHISVPQYLPLVLNWNSSKFINGITSHIREHGCPTLVVAWFHNDEYGEELACALMSYCKNEIDLFQVLGSASADPSKTNCADVRSFAPNVRYHQVLLGFQVEHGGSRWLTDNEISTGVISAIDSKDVISVVGTVTPWSARP